MSSYEHYVQYTHDHPDWRHRWLNAGHPYDAFAIWLDAKWPDDRQKQLQMFVRFYGRWPEGIEKEQLDVSCYSKDPELDRLNEMRTPHVSLVPFSDRPF